MTRPRDVSQAPETPQYQLGATSSEAAMAEQVANNPLAGPGTIVQRLGQQFQMPKAQPDATMSNRPASNAGTS